MTRAILPPAPDGDAITSWLRERVEALRDVGDVSEHRDAHATALPPAVVDDLAARVREAGAEVFADDGIDDGELPWESRGASLVYAPSDGELAAWMRAPVGGVALGVGAHTPAGIAWQRVRP